MSSTRLALLGLFITLLAAAFLPAWAKRVDTREHVITTLGYYFHDDVSGSSPTALRITQATNESCPTLFGHLVIVDDALTVGPDPNSKIVGRARERYGSARKYALDFGLIMVTSYVFTDGIYDGNSFSLLSINPAMKGNREMAIVGGTGLFRFASGYAIAQTYSFNTAGDAIVHYKFTLCTYI